MASPIALAGKSEVECVSIAIANGYQSGSCAHLFIDTCIHTTSLDELKRVLGTDRQLGVVSVKDCPNMEKDYVKEFNKQLAEADKW